MSKATQTKAKKYFSPETRRKISEAMKARWRRDNEAGAAMRSAETVLIPHPHSEIECAICGNKPPTNVVKYVPDDEVTAKVEMLRKLMSHDQLVGALLVMLHNLVGAAKGADSGE